MSSYMDSRLLLYAIPKVNDCPLRSWKHLETFFYFFFFISIFFFLLIHYRNRNDCVFKQYNTYIPTIRTYKCIIIYIHVSIQIKNQKSFISKFIFEIYIFINHDLEKLYFREVKIYMYINFLPLLYKFN